MFALCTEVLCTNVVLSANRLLYIKRERFYHVIKVLCSSLLVANKQQYGPTTFFLWMNISSPTPLLPDGGLMNPGYIFLVSTEISKLAEIPDSVEFQCGSECSPAIFVKHGAQTNKPAPEESLAVVLHIHIKST